MPTSEEFEIGEGGQVTRVIEETKLPAPAATTDNYGRILLMIDDPDTPPGEVGKLIAKEMLKLMQQMNHPDPLQRGTMSQREMTEQIKSLREIQRSLKDSEEATKKDMLNLDGPKFAYVFKTFVGLFEIAMKETGVSENMRKQVMLQFTDLLAAKHEDIRKEVNKI
jgi:hypothetical protein